jgi:hypothetical protein
MSAVAAGVPAVDGVMIFQLGQERKPLLMAGCPTMEHDQGRTVARNFQVDFFTIFGQKRFHTVTQFLLRIPESAQRVTSEGEEQL